MSDFQFRRLERHKVGGTARDMQLSIALPKSPSGKIYRFCPQPDCEPNLFQIGESITHILFSGPSNVIFDLTSSG